MSLADLRVLLVEDEAFLALDLSDTLMEAGARVIGPIASLTEVVHAAQNECFDAAILDIDLQGHEVFPAARIIADRHIPFLFHTGHGRAADLEPAFKDVPTCAKPFDPVALLRVLESLIKLQRGQTEDTAD